MAFLFYFQCMNSISLNGKIIPAEEPALLATNRSYRYGDGLFETMKIIQGKIVLSSLHFERLLTGLALLKFEIPKLFTVEKLQQEILQLCKKNRCDQLSRVRLSVFRGNGGIYDDTGELQYIIECWPVNESVNNINENGLVIDIYPDAKKSCDIFSNLKSANFLPYAMAALYAKENKLNDCLLLNTTGNIADSTIANVFVIKDRIMITPALSEGCINGVMRRKILELQSQIPGLGLHIKESVLSTEDLVNADEIFLTNAMNGIRWVRQIREKTKTNLKTLEIYKQLVQPIFIERVH